MVLLTITPSIVEALHTLNTSETSQKGKAEQLQREGEPSLESPSAGNPISHGQVVDLWKTLTNAGHSEYTLENLLKGSRVYIPPPPPKPEPSEEYKALMARLRREEEQRNYERMINPPPPTETFSQRFPGGTLHMGQAHAFAEVNRPTHASDLGDDDVTYNDVHRQVMLILNFLVSIVGVAATLWILARWWSTPARLFLAMGGSVLVGIAEVAVYSGYVWHLNEANKKDKKLKEVKEVVQTWVVGPDTDNAEEPLVVDSKSTDETNLRRRKKEPL
ncbi:endoplasmic reticulum-based factor for assembly of V-ATPase-domain-containing protein [Diplogelasinospora grovesii]|uniref:Endoplasmic reticulum-based factor for assembly of V-ATPase-domain-containing protein n=1 Tax=Diplogelasinospora grovesii TaxID=303347 RepID=A0AAN6S229_9PEZI|nr:endoplasmic reticulum-based factor for assembly of V-ATPase-domain-containing protein [Diplogelasinospora grovesii]